jgi:hypothetical protein
LSDTYKDYVATGYTASEDDGAGTYTVAVSKKLAAGVTSGDDKTATATISGSIDKDYKDAEHENATVGTNNVTFDVTTKDESATSTNVTITADTADSLKEYDTAVTVKTDVATITLDTKAVEDVANAANSEDGIKSNVTLTVENTTADNSDDKSPTSSIKIDLKDENGDSVATELSGEVTVSMAAPVGAKEGDTVYIYRMVDGIAVEPVEATVVDGQVIFSTSVMGEYGLFEAPVDEDTMNDNLTKEHKDEKGAVDGGPDGVCDDCGQVMGAYLYSHTLTLDGDIGVNYYMYLTSDVAALRDSYMEFIVAGYRYTVTVNDAKKSGDYYVFTCSTYAPEMTDTIQATFHLVKNGQDVAVSTKDYSYSVAQYAANVKAKYAAGDARYSDELIALIDAMLNYGGKSQVKFAHSIDNLADAGIDMSTYDYTYDLRSGKDGKKLSGSGVKGITYDGATLMMNAMTTVRYYFIVDKTVKITQVADGYVLDGISATVDGLPAVFQKGTGTNEYYLETAGIPASNLRGRHIVEVFDDTYDEDTYEGDDGYEGYLEIKYGAMSYVLSKLSKYTSDFEAIKGNSTLEMCLAMYYYYVAAVNYFGA